MRTFFTQKHLWLVALVQLRKPLVQRLLVLLIAATMLLAGSVVALVPFHRPLFSSPPFALAIGPIVLPRQLCSTSKPSADLCNRQDPIQQGCTADAQTLVRKFITSSGRQVGLLELRFSPRCNSYWGRTFSLSSGYAETTLISPYQIKVTEPLGGPSYAAYTPMIFGPQPIVLVGRIHILASLSASAQIP